MNEDISFLIGSLGISILLSLSAAGSCLGMSACGTSSTLNCTLPSVVTYSYVAMIMISTIFFYAFILAIIIMNQISVEYGNKQAVFHFAASLIFGTIGLVSGKAMGNISKEGFRRIVAKNDYFISFLISLASIEVTLVIAFLCSLLVIFVPK